MSNITFLDRGSFKKPVDVYLITNCIDNAYVYTSKNKADAKIKEFPDYTVYEWPQLRYCETFYNDVEINWRRARKRTNDGLVFDDTETPWNMLELARDLGHWHTNRRFSSLSFAKSEYANRKYYKICGYDVPMEKETNDSSLWFPGFAGAEITNRDWLSTKKNELHPNDDWTNVNLETYVRWIGAIDYDERRSVIDAALKARVVGYLD